MPIHILLPQERFAALLKAEYERDLLTEGGVGNWSRHYVALNEPENGRQSLDTYKSSIDYACKQPGGLANHLGYQYTVSTDADYFANLEDMLGGEE